MRVVVVMAGRERGKPPSRCHGDLPDSKLAQLHVSCRPCFPDSLSSQNSARARTLLYMARTRASIAISSQS